MIPLVELVDISTALSQHCWRNLCCETTWDILEKVKIIKVKKLKLLRFKCSKCFRSFSKRYMLNSHLKNLHKNSYLNYQTEIPRTSAMKSIKCSACKRIFPSAKDWKAHEICSKEKDIFECIECKVKLKSSLMSDHLARVHGVSINYQSHASKGGDFSHSF